ncbi:MAG: Hsp20/alpha crystallin family protein [bacterium]
MAIERFRPAKEISKMFRMMDEMMQDFARWGFPSIAEREEYFIYPPIDVLEDEKELVIKAEIPGVEKENIKVLVDNNMLTISGEKRAEKAEEGKNFYSVERRFGSFKRVITLPSTIDPDNIKATYKDGVLTVVLPKKEEARAKEIKITTE